MVSVSADIFLGRLLSVIESEVTLLGGVGEEIDNLKRELSAIGAFLVDAEKKNGLTESEKMWVEQVKKIAYDVELIIDEFTYHVNSQQVGGQFTRSLRGTFYLPKNLWVRRKIASKLQKINNTLRAIPETNRRYGLERVVGSSSSQNDGNWLRDIGESSLFVNEDHLVGIDHQKQLLTEWLVDGESSLAHFTLVGMGGSGKTTLAAQIYTNDNTVKRHFQCCAWITISQTYVIDDLLRRLIKEFFGSTKETIPSDLNTMAYRDLLFVLVNYLKTRRYLIVLDDVWEAKLLMEMALVFQNTHLGSRIIVTTRNEEVASFSFGVPSRSHHIQPLPKVDCWALFTMKAFTHQGKSCPPEIEPVARELVGRCDGLPLAIVALGGLMASKTSIEEWSGVLEDLSWQLFNNTALESMTKRILLLSFNDLPYRLKHCFLYCSIFPEDHFINSERLMRLWLAEGFVEEDNRVRQLKIAERYFLELISRSMLQNCSQNRARIQDRCKMHDLMRELALSISETGNFSVFYDGKQKLEGCKTRRLSIQTRDHKLKYYTDVPQLCSLLVFVKDDTILSLSDVLPSGLKLLRVLDLEDVPIKQVPRELPYLFNIRYVNLYGTAIKELPNSIGSLHNLETLNVGRTLVEKLPSGVSKCKKLRFLYMSHHWGSYFHFKSINGTRAPPDIYNLKELEVMLFIEAEGDIIRNIGNMTQLTELGITNVREEDGMDLCVSIQNLKQLQLLYLMAADEEKLLKIEALSSPPPLLNDLRMCGKLERVPLWFSSLQRLRSLDLNWTRLADNPLPHICTLPCLEELRLLNAYAPRTLHFSSGFLKLRELYLSHLFQLTEIVIEGGVMPDLKILSLFVVMERKELPRGIEYLTKLDSLGLNQVSEELVDRIRGEGAVDRPKVKHIAKIDYSYKSEGKWNRESLS